ncbi:MAG TPA: Spy/CpxP family protein refolding chaperone [Usitatibacteraceae bacterium]|nr:Spy/CpxP family protein refolding chaperone [Usitatibacteraceae bacterium]
MTMISLHTAARLFILLAVAAGAAQAQTMPRGGRGEGGAQRPQQAPRGERPETRGSTAVTDPIAALERELPSLRLDLKLDGPQAALFDSFQRAVRDASEAARARLKQLMAFRLDDASTVSAASIVQAVADADQARAAAMAAVIARMDALYASFSADQRKMFDRRVMQSQREPLGNS